MYIRSLKECDYSQYNRPSNNNPHEFELLVRDCAVIELGQDFHLYGRSGQTQHGIDIFSDDWTIVIQCKAYSEAPKSYETFRTDIEAEFTKAKNHFQRDGKLLFRQFIIATILNTDGPAQGIAEKLSEQEPNVKVIVWFWDDLLKIVNQYKDRLHNDVDQYAEGFEETLFLHKNRPGCEHVRLYRLFVPQEYRELIRENGLTDSTDKPPIDDTDKPPIDDLLDRIQRFCVGQEKTLIVEGDAGSGKSTLAAKLCFEERKHSRQEIEPAPDGGIPSPPAPSLLGGRPLLTVRLRDLKISGNPEFDFGALILSHLHIPDKQELVDRFPSAVFLLDGFDELCMKVKESCSCENMLAQLCGWLPGNCKIILTSRPKYIQMDQLSNASSFSLISLQHFSRKKREEWLDQYRELFKGDSSAVDEEVAQYILSIDEDSVSNLCDTPMTLYLLIGGKVTIELTKNEWALYHYIFADAVVNTPYAKQLGGALHPMGKNIGDLLYWITEEIAYKMYCTGEAPEDQDTILTEDGQFLVTGETVTKIIEKLLQEEPFQKAAYKAGLKDANGFDLQRIHALCCYWRSAPADGPVEFYHNNIRDFFLCEKIRREFNGFYQEKVSDDEKTDRMAQRLVSLFKYGEINLTVCRFLLAYTRDAVSKQDQKEFPLREKEHPLLPMLFQKLLTQGRLYDNLEMDDHIEAIRSILLSTGLVYRHVYEMILKKGEKIHWWQNVDAVNPSGMMRFIFKNCVGHIGSKSDLQGADLNEADLNGAILSVADLGRANLRGADLRGANLRGAHLQGADLGWADLRGADLSGTHLREAELRLATLPDGFQSDNQDEQTVQLRLLRLLSFPGLKL